MKITRVALVLALLLPGTLFAATKEQKVRQLLVLTGAGNLGVQVIDGLMGNMKQALPNVPAEFWTEFRKSVKPSEMIDLVVPIYAKHLEESDIDELIRFYGSPTGKRFVAQQPLILQDSMLAGQKWGEALAERALDKLQKKGYVPKS